MRNLGLTLICFCVYTLSLFSQDAYHTSLETNFQDNFNLPAGTWLFYEEEAAILENATGYGGSFSTQESGGADYAQILQATITSAGTNQWDSGWNMRNQKTINKGDKVLVLFYIRSVGGSGMVNIFAEDGITFNKEIFLSVDVEEEWKQYVIPFEATKNFPIGTAVFGFHLGHQKQVIDIGGYTAINFGNSISLSALPNEVNNDKYDGYQSDAPWRAVATENIEKFRKTNLNINVITTDGEVVPDMTFGIKMLSHEFAFGTAINADKIAGNNLQNNTYESKLINLDGKGHGFNWVVYENDMKWPAWEEEWLVSREELINSVQWLRDHQIKLRGHTLVWPGEGNLPSDLNENRNNLSFMKNRIEGHLQSILNYPGLKGNVEEWDVLNEITTNRSLEEYFRGKQGYVTGREVLAEIFQQARSIDSNTGLWLNDFITISVNAKPGNGNYDNLKLFTRELLDAGVDLEGIGFQGHIGGFPNGIPSVLETLDDFHLEFGLKAKITEFDLPTTVEEELAGDYLRDFMTAIFSHESMDGFFFWSFWDGATYMNKGANLFRFNWQRSPAGDAFVDLVFNEWWTDESIVTNTEGVAASNVFKGLYEVNYLLDGAMKRDTLSITEPTDISIVVDPITTAIDNISKEREYIVLYPNPVDSHIIIKQLEQKHMHVRLLNLGGQVLQEQWTEALEIDLYVENLKGLFIVEIEYEGGVFSKTVVIQ